MGQASERVQTRLNVMTTYSLKWDAGTTQLDIEMFMIRKGGRFKHGTREVGEGLFHHYKQLQSLLWPNEDHHRWSDLQLREYLTNTITVCSGVKNSGKTHSASKFALADYYCFPEITMIIISSTTRQSLETRVWGDIKSLHVSARKLWPELPGNVIDGKMAISTDDLSDDETEARDMRKGILCLACKKNSGEETDISNYVGIKQQRRRWIGDEMQFMKASMIEALANANDGNFKLLALGNPLGIGDPLDVLSEPKCGWDNFDSEFGEVTKTIVWDNKLWKNSRTISLIGPDSPNFDYPKDKPIRFPYLFNQDSMDRVLSAFDKDSTQFWSQCVGLRRPGNLASRVISIAMCEQNKAFEPATWLGTGQPNVKIGALDAAYGGTGGDRCVGGIIEFGKSVDNVMTISVNPPVIVPVSVRKTGVPEDQIAEWCAHYFDKNGVRPENFFYDATGRGSLGPSLARIWSNMIQPVEFGGSPTKRIVSRDVTVLDPKTGFSRPQRCDELYRNFVTELWFSVKWVISCGQMRNLPREVAQEGTLREFEVISGFKMQVEPKDEMKKRIGRSPDLFDWLATAVEGARRRGFQIAKFSSDSTDNRANDPMWLTDWRQKAVETSRKGELLEV